MGRLEPAFRGFSGGGGDIREGLIPKPAVGSLL